MAHSKLATRVTRALETPPTLCVTGEASGVREVLSPYKGSICIHGVERLSDRGHELGLPQIVCSRCNLNEWLIPQLEDAEQFHRTIAKAWSRVCRDPGVA